MRSTFPDISISTDRLVLHPFQEADVPELAEMMNDELTATWSAAPYPFTVDDARNWVTGAPAERADGRGIMLAVTEHLTHRLVGEVHLRSTDWHVRATEVGCVIAPWARGEGYAAEAVLAVVQWLFHDQKFERLEFRTAAGNTASQRVAQKIGCVSEGILRNAMLVRTRTEDDGWTDIRTDVIVWSLLPEDLEETPAG